MMDGVEVGRVNVAARACGIMIRAFELAIAYAQQRMTFGRQIAEHQAIAFKLAEMATKVEAAHLMMVNAARLKDAGERNDVEAGMAKLLASEYCAEVTPSRSASTAATATPRSTRSSGCSGRRRSCSSARAPPRSRRRSSAAA